MVAAGFTQTTVESVTTLGQQLLAARLARAASVSDAQTATSVAAKYLTALEHGQYHLLPADVYVVGFVRRYAGWLELDVPAALTAFKRERSLADATHPDRLKAIPVRTRTPLALPRVVITPERFMGLAVSAFVLVVVGYVWFQVKSFAAAPSLELAGAIDNEVVTVDTLTLAGSTDADAKLAINGELVPVDQTGHFTATIRLVNGVNTIELKAQNRIDRETVRILKVLATLNDTPGAPGAELPVQLPPAP